MYLNTIQIIGFVGKDPCSPWSRHRSHQRRRPGRCEHSSSARDRRHNKLVLTRHNKLIIVQLKEISIMQPNKL